MVSSGCSVEGVELNAQGPNVAARGRRPRDQFLQGEGWLPPLQQVLSAANRESFVQPQSGFSNRVQAQVQLFGWRCGSVVPTGAEAKPPVQAGGDDANQVFDFHTRPFCPRGSDKYRPGQKYILTAKHPAVRDLTGDPESARFRSPDHFNRNSRIASSPAGRLTETSRPCCNPQVRRFLRSVTDRTRARPW